MRHFIISILATGLIVFAASVHSLAGPISPAGLSLGDAAAPVILVQAKKDETLQQKAKRAWRNLVGYKFDVNCPINNRRTCAETGKSRDDARSKCIARNPLCWVSDAK
jgi:hypothetical protein